MALTYRMFGYLSLDIICSLELTIFLELRSRKTVRFPEQIMSADKYRSVFSRQMLANENRETKTEKRQYSETMLNRWPGHLAKRRSRTHSIEPLLRWEDWVIRRTFLSVESRRTKTKVFTSESQMRRTIKRTQPGSRQSSYLWRKLFNINHATQVKKL